MQSDALFAKDKLTSLFVHGATEASAAQLVVQDDVRLTAMVGCQPSVDGLCACFAAVLRSLPSVMQPVGQPFEARLCEQTLETVPHHESQPARCYDYSGVVLSKHLLKHLSCGSVEKLRPKFRRRIWCDYVVASELAWEV